MRLGRKAIVITLTLCLMASLTGCKKKKTELTKQDYISLYDDTANKLEEANQTIESLKMELNAYGEEMTEEDITQPYELMSDGETPVYNTFNHYMIFKQKLSWDDTSKIGNVSKLKLDDVFSLTPSNTWSSKISSGYTEMYNDAGISAKLKLSEFYESMDAVFLYSEHIKPYLNEIGAKKITNKNIYVDGSACGILSRGIIAVNKKVDTEEKMKVREDFLQNGNKTLLDEQAKKEKENKSKDKSKKSTEDDVKSLDEITNDGSSLDNSIDTDSSLSGTASPETTDDANKKEQKLKYKNVTVTTTEKKKVEYVYYVGVVNANNEILQYQFIFENDSNAKMKEELVIQLLKSVQVGDVNLTLE